MRQRFAYCLAFPCLYLLHRMAGFPFLPSKNSLNQLFPRPRYFSPPQLSRRRRRHRGACISNIYLPIAFSPLLMLLIFQLSFIVLWGCFSLPRIIGVLQPHFTPIADISYQIPLPFCRALSTDSLVIVTFVEFYIFSSQRPIPNPCFHLLVCCFMMTADCSERHFYFIRFPASAWPVLVLIRYHPWCSIFDILLVTFVY